MASIELHEEASGPCVVCGKESEGSPYWIGMSQTIWLKLRPHIKHLFKPDFVMKTMFIPPYDKPLCGPNCAGQYDGQTMHTLLRKSGSTARPK